MDFSRRRFFQLAGAAGVFFHSQASRALQSSSITTSTPHLNSEASTVGDVSLKKAKVGLARGESRRKNVYEALLNIDEELQAGFQHKKYVLIKPNIVNTEIQLASTHADALNGILDYLAPRFRGPVMIAESSAGDTLVGYDHLGYRPLEKEWKSHQLSLVDLNREAKYETLTLIDYDLHITPVRLAARLFDPDAYVICCAAMKTHNAAVASLSIKNMVLGAPLHSTEGESNWNDKRKYHVGIRQMQYNMLLTAEKMRPYWGAAVIDGYEGMEGNGPNSGTPVASRLSIASTDYLAADRVALETMGINADWPGYLNYCARVGVGQYDLSRIEVLGAPIASVKKKYRLHMDIERQLQWMGPMEDLPPRLGRLLDEHSFKYA
jgi:uncharacterized protein (DUF362 family)